MVKKNRKNSSLSTRKKYNKKNPAKNNKFGESNRKPRVLWANPYCLLDTSSGASISVREILFQLLKSGFEISILGATIFDDPKGMANIIDELQEAKTNKKDVIKIKDGPFQHHLIVTENSQRSQMTAKEEDTWFAWYDRALKDMKPDLVFYYGGRTLDFLIAQEARVRNIPSVAYLVNGNFRGRRWCRDTDLIITDSQATSDYYREKEGFTPQPVGKFINPEKVIAKKRDPKNITFINPSLAKGAGVVVQLALMLEKQRPDITFEVVESRGNWGYLVKNLTKLQGGARESLNNVVVTPNTNDMRTVYSRSRLLLAPSLWWESGARVLAEAMLNGIPAITTKRGGSPEMIQDGGVVLELPEQCHQEPFTEVPLPEILQPLVDMIIKLYDDDKAYEVLSEKAYTVGKNRHKIDVSTNRLLNAFAPLLRQRAGDVDGNSIVESLHKQPDTRGLGKAHSPQSVPGVISDKVKPAPDQIIETLLPDSTRDKPGSIRWVIEKESQFGGLVRGVERNKVSEFDPRTPDQLKRGGMQGGDRMSFSLHGYAIAYASFLKPFLDGLCQSKKRSLTLMEVGILKGTGLALWCDLFPSARVLGLDIDLGHCKNNIDNLKGMGAFKNNKPELYHFDQLKGTVEDIRLILNGDDIDIFIDDGLHSKESILTTLRAIKPHLSKKFVVFIEDNANVEALLKEEMPEYRVIRQGEMTVICPDTEGFPKRIPTLEQLATEIQIMRKRLGYEPNIEYPSTFNEKIVHRKLFGAPKKASMLADKLAVRDVVKKRLGEGVLTKVYQVVDSESEIDWDALPGAFVMKSNHANAQVKIVRDKSDLDKDAAEILCGQWLSSVYGESSNEYWYAQIEPKVFFEELLDEKDGVASDYKVHCFHGKPKLIQKISGRYKDTREIFYYPDWTPSPYRLTYPKASLTEKPKKLEEMLEFASKLAEEMDYVRVDFYLLNDRVCFGEMTFAPAAGWDAWKVEGDVKTALEVDREIGSWW